MRVDALRDRLVRVPHHPRHDRDRQTTIEEKRELYAIGLTREERAAVLACLEDSPNGLVELRGVLMREHRG